MACTSKIVLINESVLLDKNSDSVSLPAKAQNCLGVLKISGYVSGTYGAIIQHSPDNVNWYTLMSIATGKTANGVFVAVPASAAHYNHCFQYVRAQIDTSAVAADGNIAVEIHFAQ